MHHFAKSSAAAAAVTADWLAFVDKTADYTLANGEHARFDLSGAAAYKTATLPTDPSPGWECQVTLAKAHATPATVNLRLDSGTSGGSDAKLMGRTSGFTAYNLCSAGETLRFRYVDSNTGWQIAHNGLQLLAGCLKNTSGQAITAAVSTKLVFNTVETGPAWFAHATNDYFLVPRSRSYRLTMWCLLASGTTAIGEFYKNGASLGLQGSQNASEQRQFISADVFCDAGDYLESYYYYSSGSASTYAGNPYFTRFTCVEGAEYTF